MYLQSQSSQPHLFTLQPLGAEGERRGPSGSLDANEFYVTNTPSQEELVSGDTQTSSFESGVGGFKMEDELEGFIDHNWDSIPFFSKLEKAGRQMPADDVGIMDFLARDPANGHLIVAELKRDRSRETALGQVQGYMGWVAENMASGDQDQVQGVIICQQQDPGLKYAVTATEGRVTVLEYQVRFILKPP